VIKNNIKNKFKEGFVKSGKRQFLLKNNRGQALVEFIFIFLVFLSIFLGVLQLTIFANIKAMSNAAVYAACRQYVVTYKKGDTTAVVLMYLAPLYKIKSIIGHKLDLDPDKDPGFGEKVKATLTVYTAPWYLPVFLLPNMGKIVTTCSMTME